MKQVKIGILGAADIAIRRFLPALKKNKNYIFAGVAVSSDLRRQKAERIVSIYGGKVYIGYENLLKDAEIDAVYIPQPPCFHYKWAKYAIEEGKHVLLEKPGTTKLEDMEDLLMAAESAKVALAENYAFCYHNQVSMIRSIIKSDELGRLRLIRAAFGFPHRNDNDFRYQSALGGGALLDCGGYVLKAAQLFLGDNVTVMTSSLLFEDEHDVDIFGSVTLQGESGLMMQASFGMDNSYKCELELWGSHGCLVSPRFFTPPSELEVELTLRTQVEERTLRVPKDDQFFHMTERFSECIHDFESAYQERQSMLAQMKLVSLIQSKNKLR